MNINSLEIKTTFRQMIYPQVSVSLCPTHLPRASQPQQITLVVSLGKRAALSTTRHKILKNILLIFKNASGKTLQYSTTSPKAGGASPRNAVRSLLIVDWKCEVPEKISL